MVCEFQLQRYACTMYNCTCVRSVRPELENLVSTVLSSDIISDVYEDRTLLQTFFPNCTYNPWTVRTLGLDKTILTHLFI